ncbi:NleF caspase inhibitor [Yersinia pseudotuberculosis]|uniref:NleF caspase inhibitor n=1 Tax=Yersinia pseudotuberculosis TaxID=633 RepID=UPI0038B5483D
MGLSLSCIRTVDNYVTHLDCNRVLPSKTLDELKINKNIINAKTQHTINDIKQKLTLIKERYDASITDEFKYVEKLLSIMSDNISKSKENLYEPEDSSLNGVQERELKIGKTAQDRNKLAKGLVALYQIKNAIKEMIPEDKTKTIDDYSTDYPKPIHNGKVLNIHHPFYSLVKESVKHKLFYDLHAIENNEKVPYVIYSKEWDEVDG